ncbi:MAG: hypothetical protein M1840_004361 [Geoglossum simile]|nr:MAG: hypothetical protein M1840_004361 [Geoglossum simile]
MEVNREQDPNAQQAQLEPQGSGNRAGPCDATEGVVNTPGQMSVEDVQDKGLAQESGFDVGGAASVNQELSAAAGVDALQRAIAAAADSYMDSTMAPHDPLGHDAMAGVDSHSGYNLPPSTPFRTRPGEEPSAPPLALHSTPPISIPLSDPMVMDSPFLETSPITQEPNEAPRIQAFAKLEFDDGQFYMNTYSVILGRDIRAARAAFQREQQERDSKEGMRGGQSTSGGDASQAAFRVKRGGSAKMNSSVVSESGGIIGADDPDGGRRKRSKRGSKKSKSTTSSSQFISRKNSIVQPIGHTDYQSLARPADTDGAHPVDPSSLLPSPEECPLIPIHPPATTGTGSHKGISRKHAKIAFNFDTHIFEVEIKGKNGAFVDDQWYAPGDVRPLKSGSFIQIGGVGVRFLLPETVVGQTGEERNYDHDNEMNFAFDNGRGSNTSSDTDEENEDDDEGVESGDDEDEVEGEDEDEGDEGEEGGGEEEIPETPSPEPIPQPVPVRRGPGRPPKNGISKRERELAEKEAKAKAKAKEKGKKVAPPVTKNKVGRPRKHSRPETPPVKPEKRKYTKRKVIDAAGSTTKTKKDPKDSKPPKEKKEKRPPKPPRSPSPIFDESKLTAEELQKPQASYVVLIHEALTNSKTGAMSLPQIYRAIERKYPFYKLRVQTTGWQSSVRHNLSQHHAFRKVERDGKGWMWGIVPGVSIEKERKKRLSPPPQPPHQALQQQPISRGIPMHQTMMPAPPGLGNGPAGPFMHPVPLNGSSAGAGYAMVHPLPQAGLPRGPDAIPQLSSNMLGATFVHSGTVPQRQPAQQSYSGKTAGTAGPVFHPMQENRPPALPTHTPVVLTTQPPVTITGPTPPQTPQHQNRGLKLNDKTLQAIASFQTALVAKLFANGSKDAEAIVQSAVNRALGVSDKSTVPGKEDPQEVAIMKAVSGMLNQINNKSQAPPSSSSAGGSAENRIPPSRPQQQQQQQARPATQQPSHLGRTSGAIQPQSQGQGSRQGQGQHAVQAQLIQFLSTALSNKSGQKASPQPGVRPPSAGSSSVGGSGGQTQTRVNGTATPRPPLPGLPPARATATAVPINVNSDKAVMPAANVQKQVRSQSPPVVAGIKRPLENGDVVEGQPETKKLAIDGAITDGESRGV